MRLLQFIVTFFIFNHICYSQVTRINTIFKKTNGEEFVTIFDTSKFEYYYGECSLDQGFRLKSDLDDGQYDVYENDILSYRAFYFERKRDSTWIYYYPNGKILYIANYKFGKLHGIFKHFNEDGSLRSEGTYVDGRETGVYIYYFPSGIVNIKNYFENGKLFRREDNDSNGQIQSESNYKTNKKKEFYWDEISYFPNGNIKEIRYGYIDRIKRVVTYDNLGNIKSDKRY